MATQIFQKYKSFILPLLIVASSVILLRNYFFPQFQILLGILISPFVFSIKDKTNCSNRYFYVSLICTGCYYLLSMKLFLFLGLGAFLFYSIESRFGRISLLPFIFLICISPALHYVVNVFTFTLRLELSRYAAELMNTVGYTVQCSGNYFIMPDGFTFNVDKACLGLNMFNTGLALTTLLIGLAEKKTGRSFSLFHLALAFIYSCGLLIVTNFLRIVTIVFFRSLPGTTSHELIGMFSMILYMALPMYFLTNLLAKHAGKKSIKVKSNYFFQAGKNMVFPVIVFALLFFSFTSVERSSKTMVRDLKLEQLQLPGFSKIKKEDGVMEYRRDSLLIYIKPAVKAFESDHPPVMCWMGSGFEVEQVSEVMVLKTKVLMAVIKKAGIIQYTAWWYDNGTTKTTSQWTWRLSKGESFRIVNITANNKKELLMNCEAFLSKKLF